jgi:pyruvate dehydrogenase E2 component (dihydrolipoamide acetyltransferase)
VVDNEPSIPGVEAGMVRGLLRVCPICDGYEVIGQTVAVIGEQGEQVELEEPSRGRDGARHGDESPTNDPQASRETASPQVLSPVGNGARHRDESVTDAPQPSVSGGRVKASPLARRIARERGIELSAVRGTGPDGRIVAEDVERAQAAPAPAAAPAPVVTG